MKTILKIVAATLLILVLGFTGLVAWLLYPHDRPQPLPEPLLAANSDKGVERLSGAEATADFQRLSESFQAQTLASYCGVASSVAVLNAFGTGTNQFDFFNGDASRVKPRFKVVFGGMSLSDLGGLLGAHGLQVNLVYADQISLAEFRSALEENLARADDYLIVNYQREELGQGRVGHISPVAAYDMDTDSVLIMDTAAHKYPPTWVPVPLLYAAMKTADSSSGKMRGFIEVSNLQGSSE